MDVVQSKSANDDISAAIGKLDILDPAYLIIRTSVATELDRLSDHLLRSVEGLHRTHVLFESQSCQAAGTATQVNDILSLKRRHQR